MPEADNMTWCEGLPLKGTRSISDPERAWAENRLVRARRARWTLDLAGVFVLIGGVSGMFVTAQKFRQTNSDIVILGFIGFPVALAVAYVCSQLARRWSDRRKSLTRDLRDGYVLVFSREAAPTQSSADLADHAPRTLEVFPSGTLYAVNGEPQNNWLTVRIVATAQVPRRAPAADALSEEEFRLTDDSIASLSSRRLTEDETRELQTFLERMKLGYSVAIPILLSVYLGLAGSHFYAVGTWWPSPVIATLAAAAMVVCAFLLWQWIRPRVAIGRDVRDGTVLVVTQEVFGDSEDEVEVHVSEYLEHSRMPWTEDGMPAEWRRRPDNSAA